MKVFWKRISVIPCDPTIANCVATTGAQVLDDFMMESSSVFDDAMILIALNFSFRTVGFVALCISTSEIVSMKMETGKPWVVHNP